MYQIDNSTAAPSQPASTATGTAGFFTDGNPATGVASTILPAEWLNAVMMELSNVVTGAGLTLAKNQFSQVLTAIKTLMQQSVSSVASDTGSANAYVVAFTPALAAPVPWAPFWFKVKTTNTGASTLNATGTPYGLVGGAHQALQGNELVANGNALVYWNPTLNSGAGQYVLVFCSGAADQVAPATQFGHAAQLGQISNKLQPIAASVASNALTLTLNPTTLDFRSATAGAGAVTAAVQIASALNITVPSGATLGTSNATAAQLALIVAYNGGSPVLCVANTAGGLSLDETGTISPTTISGGSNSAGVVYSASAVSAGSPYRVVGYVTVTEATAGTWATAPSLAQGLGGMSIANLLGVCAAFGSSKASVGYQKLPGGLIIQWGSATVAGGAGQATATFPIAFPTSMLIDTTLAGNVSVGIYGASATQSSRTWGVYNTTNGANASNGVPFSYIAIGY